MPASLKHLDSNGFTQITGYSWTDALAGQAQTARKFGVQNDGTRVLNNYTLSIEAIGTNDGSGQFRIGLDTLTLSAPYGVSVTATGAGVGGLWGATGTIYYKLTAYNATGETIGCTEVSVVIDVVTKKAVLVWTQISGATGYKLYRSLTSGVYGASSLRATIIGASTVTYTDDGSGLSSGTVPSDNTTGGVAPIYGAVPTLDILAILFGNIAVGEQRFYWANRIVAAGVSEIANTRQTYLRFEEA